MEVSDFNEMSKDFLREIEKSFETGDVENVRTCMAKMKLASNVNRRSALEQAVKDKALDILSSDNYSKTSLESLMNLTLRLCREELVSPVLSVIVLGDLFDSTTLEVSEEMFSYVEANVSTWKEPLFFSSCKNNILRMCNDLLRRLSKSQNTVFCGRILLFLAMFFPFSERSGLNIVSEFNVDNVTKYGGESTSDDIELNTLEEIVPETSIKIDYNFYVKFWSLQDYFRSPYQCYNKLQWKEFVNHSSAVLSVFKNYKVDPDPTGLLNNKTKEYYFAKFLTNQKLLVLQLNDVNFRRTIYLQFLILFQFLNAHVKSKPESFELKPDQVEWVKETTDLINQLIKETPPDGEAFLEIVQKLFERDEHWNSWKNDGCPALTPVGSQLGEPIEVKKGVKRKKPLGEAFKDSKTTGRIVISCDDGHRVWETRGESLKFCSKRNYLPNLHKYFDEAIQQSDPNAGIEPQFKKTNNMRYAWSALRLLAMKCPHYFAVTQNPISKLPDFLDSMCRKISKEQITPPSRLNPVKQDPLESVDQESEQMVVEVERENGEVDVQVKRDTDSDTDTKDSKEKEVEDEEEDDVEDDEEEEEYEEDEEDEEEENNDDDMKMDDQEDGEVVSPKKKKTNGLAEEASDEATLKKDILEEVGALVSSSWQKLAEKLGYKADEVEYFASVGETEDKRAKNMLIVWASNEDGATARNLQKNLTSLIGTPNTNESSIKEAVKLLSSV